MASDKNPKTVLLSGDPVQYEGILTAAATPGMLVVKSASGIAPGAAKSFSVLRERDFVGEGIDKEVPSGETAPYYVGRKGDCFYALLATGNNVAVDAELQATSAGTLELKVEGDGTVTAGELGGFPGDAVCVALEAINNTTGSPVRLKVEVI